MHINYNNGHLFGTLQFTKDFHKPVLPQFLRKLLENKIDTLWFPFYIENKNRSAEQDVPTNEITVWAPTWVSGLLITFSLLRSQLHLGDCF